MALELQPLAGVLVTLGAAALTAFGTVPFSVWLARHTGTMDVPAELKIHSQPIPRLGGVGIIITIGLFVGPAAVPSFGALGLREVLLVSACAATAALGVVDDVRTLPQTVKFAVEALIGVAIAVAVAPSSPWGMVAALLLFLAMTNGYNFIDGVDGLAGGLAVIHFAILAILIELGGGHSMAAYLALVCAASTLGFLRANWPPARVFLGDGGSLTLGALATVCSLVWIYGPGDQTLRWPAALLAAAFPLGEVGFTAIRRVVARRTLDPRRLFPGDRSHYYDQLMVHARLEARAVLLPSIACAAVMGAAGVGIIALPVTIGATLAAVAVSALVWLGWRSGIRLRSE